LLISAKDDLEALQAFLASHEASPETHRKYARECERLFLWAWHERDKAVSSLMTNDYEAYLAFLANPQPACTWCGPKTAREKPEWRPFVGPLAEVPMLTAFAALDAFLQFLCAGSYLYGNPLTLIKQRRKQAKKLARQSPERALDEGAKVERFLDPEMWLAVTQAIEQLPEDSPQRVEEKERLRFICSFLYLLGPRASELENMRMNSFREVRGRWWWYVLGKGAKFAKVAVPDDMVTALVRYRKHLGLSAVPSKTDDSPLMRALRTGEPITARRLNQLLKTLFHQAAEILPAEAEHKKEKLRAASAHWGRHTAVTARVDAKMDMRYVQLDARHKDRRTTELYTHAEDEAWHDDTQKVTLPWTPGRDSSDTQ
jgi:site-specific recombinase XerD